jgi:aryl-alcohol dehydrogenase-like predicted oxidoreductase
MTYCHYTLNDSTLATSGFLEWCAERGIGVMNAAAVSMGLLTKRGPPDWHPAKPHQKAACKSAAEWCTENGFDLSKLALHFTLHTNALITTTLCSTSKVSRVLSNIADATTTLTEEEKAATAHILATFFDPLKGDETWEGVETEKYFRKLKAAQEKAAQKAAT